jgi:HK97 gp10 family phage protein
VRTIRVARSKAKLDVSAIDGFQSKMNRAVRDVEKMADEWEQKWGGEWVKEMQERVPVSSGRRSPGSRRYGHLRDNIRQVEPGGITFGDAYWWLFLERGTSRMSARPFIKPAMKKIRTPARKDATARAIDLLQKGRM